MKKRTAKKAKVASKAKAKAKKNSVVQELQERNLRLTREFDTLATKVAAQGHLLAQINLALQVKMILPYEPVSLTPQEAPRLELKAGTSLGAFASMRSTPKYHTVRVMRHETTLGYLAADGGITVDPTKIHHFGTTEEAKAMIAKVGQAQGQKFEIEGH
jgi:hypothetical protein